MDDLLDLNWSDSSKPSQPTLRPTSSSSTSRQPTPNPTFDFLSKQSSNSSQPSPLYSSTPPIRAATPKTAPLPAQSRFPTAPAVRSSTPNPQTKAAPAPPSDAFASLFSLDASSKPNGQPLSLAEKQQQITEEKRRKEEHERQQFSADGDFWENLGSSSTKPKVASSSNNGILSSSNGLGELDDLLSPQPVRPIRPPSRLSQSITPTPTPPVVKETAWDDDDTFLAGSGSNGVGNSAVPKKSTTGSAFDFDALNRTVNGLQPQKRNGASGSSGMRTPVSNFDFGEGKGDNEDDDDDFLGELGRPAKPLAARTRSPSPKRQPRTTKKPTARSNSPPPHVVGALFEMGFDPTEARAALAQTSTGIDVEAAVEILTAKKQRNGRQTSRFDDEEEEDEDRVMRERQRREEEEAERRRRRRAGPSRDSVKARSRDEIDRQSTPNGEYGEQAEKILAQASEIGQSFMKSATTFWSSGKEKAMKMLEEQRRAMELEGARSKRRDPGDGRPRWMTDAEDQQRNDPRRGDIGGGFKDSDDEGSEEPVRRRPNGTSRRPPEDRQPTPKEAARIEADLLGGGDAPRSYQPPSRHPTRSRAPGQASTRPVARPRTPPPLIQRSIVAASASQTQNSSSYKAKGNEHFKLGRFSEAESAYSSAITQLPEGNLFLVPIYNNRAATRIKLGESASAAEDCSTVIELIGPSYHPSKEAPLPSEYAEVKLGDALVKAYTKRAQAYEMGEKWSKAVEDWERVLGFDIALMGPAAQSTKTLASEGARRARKMLEPPSEPIAAAPKPKSKAAPVVRPSKPLDMANSKAVGEMRKASQAAEAEDAQRIAWKDVVDAKVIAWKGGKETNLRALIASLDTVLWDEIMAGGLKVGMHELITEKQVKIKYMKVIARLHPDKLDVKKTTVEQRMLANAAFSTLNDAWQAFNNA